MYIGERPSQGRQTSLTMNDAGRLQKMKTGELRDLLDVLHCSRSGRKGDLVDRVLTLSDDPEVAHTVNRYIAEKEGYDDNDTEVEHDEEDLDVQIARLTVDELKALLELLNSAHSGRKAELVKRVQTLSENEDVAQEVKNFILQKEEAKQTAVQVYEERLEHIEKPGWAIEPAAIRPGDRFSFVYLAGMRAGKRRTVSFKKWCLLKDGVLGLCAVEEFGDPPMQCTYKAQLIIDVFRSPSLADQVKHLTAKELERLLISLKKESGGSRIELVHRVLELSCDNETAQCVSQFLKELNISKNLAAQEMQDRLEHAAKPAWAREPAAIVQGDRLSFVYAGGMRAGKRRTVTFDAWVELSERSLGMRVQEDFGDPPQICHYHVHLVSDVERICSGAAEDLKLNELHDLVEALRRATICEKRQRILEHSGEELMQCVDCFMREHRENMAKDSECYKASPFPAWAREPVAIVPGVQISFVYDGGSRACQRRKATFMGWTQLSGGRLGFSTIEDFGGSVQTRQYDVQLVRDVQRP